VVSFEISTICHTLLPSDRPFVLTYWDVSAFWTWFYLCSVFVFLLQDSSVDQNINTSGQELTESERKAKDAILLQVTWC
jgi:hypothetical protein